MRDKHLFQLLGLFYRVAVLMFREIEWDWPNTRKECRDQLDEIKAILDGTGCVDTDVDALNG